MENNTNQNNYDILKERPLTLRQIIGVIIFAVSLTFTLALLYGRFLSIESTQRANKELYELEFKILNEKLEYFNDRLSRKFKAVDKESTKD